MAWAKRRVGAAGDVRWTAIYKDGRGRERSAGTAPTKKLALELAREQEVDLSRGDWIDPAAGTMTFGEYGDHTATGQGTRTKEWPNGVPVPHNHFRGIWRRARRAAEVPELRTHDLRASNLSWLLSSCMVRTCRKAVLHRSAWSWPLSDELRGPAHNA